MKKNSLIIGVVIIVVIGLILFGGALNKNDGDQPTNEMTNDEMTKEDEMMNKNMTTEEDMMDEEMKDHLNAVDEMNEPVMMNPGVMAEDFTLKDIQGNEVSLSDYKGQKVYIKFWASWCSICLAGLDDIDTLSMSEDIKVLTIVAPGEKGEMKEEAFIKWFEGLNYEHMEVLLDKDGMIQKAFNVRGFPTSAFVGSDQILVQVIPGHIDNDMILKTFEAIY
ncbi:MAG: redoxin domain-containing protein [Clostridia bacterium]|nr:redoxin domain-containing protein [Clostridia bacterium]